MRSYGQPEQLDHLGRSRSSVQSDRVAKHWVSHAEARVLPLCMTVRGEYVQ